MLRRAISTIIHLHSTNEGSTFKVPCNKQFYVVKRKFFCQQGKKICGHGPIKQEKMGLNRLFSGSHARVQSVKPCGFDTLNRSQ